MERNERTNISNRNNSGNTKRKATKKDVFSLTEAFSIRPATKTDLVHFQSKEDRRKDGDWVAVPK